MELQKLIDGLKAHKNGAASYESVDEAIRVFEAMRDVDGEKVDNGLECCASGQSCFSDCPYNDQNDMGIETCTSKLCADALALIQQQAEKIHELQTKNHELQTAQTARMVTLEEIKDGESYWLSAGKEFVTRPVICVHREDDARKQYITLAWQFGTFSWESEDYGKRWCCWTQRPTDEKMEAVKWNA